MATIPKPGVGKAVVDAVPAGKALISFEEALGRLSGDERFRATVYAMNTLLVQKGIYSPQEFEFQFCQWAQKHLK